MAFMIFDILFLIPGTWVLSGMVAPRPAGAAHGMM
jgi:hypothetical protein